MLSDNSPPSKVRIWLHRIGYVATTLVALQIAVVLGVTAYQKLEQNRREAERRSETRLRRGVLGLDSPLDVGRAEQIRLLASMPKQAGDVMRVVVMPSLGYYSFSVALYRKPSWGFLKVERHGWDESLKFYPGENRIFRFAMPKKTYSAIVSRLNVMLADYKGDPGNCVDETSLALERVRDGKLESAAGSCDEMTPRFRAELRRSIAPLLPSGAVPLEDDWHGPVPLGPPLPPGA